MKILITGCGYVGLPLGALLVARGHSVTGLRRSPKDDAQLTERGITPLHLDITDPAQVAELPPTFDVVVNLVSSSKGGLDDYRQVYFEGTKNIIRRLTTNRPRLYLYTSSTSVYAQADGSLVTEQSPAEPGSATSQVLIETENELLKAHRASAFPAIILRASGIYGPKRGHLFKQFLRGEATMRDDGSSWLNMIHVDDLAAAIAHLIDRGQPGEIYNASDDEPVTQLAFFHWLSTSLDRPMPPTAPPDPSRKRGLTNKRVSNARLKSTGFTFKYPTFREGYAAEMQRLSLKPPI